MNENISDTQTSIDYSDIELARQLFGEHNSNLHKIAKDTDVRINARGNTVFIDFIGEGNRAHTVTSSSDLTGFATTEMAMRSSAGPGPGR